MHKGKGEVPEWRVECLNRVVALQRGLRLARRLVAGSLQTNTTTLCASALPPLHKGVR